MDTQKWVTCLTAVILLASVNISGAAEAVPTTLRPPAGYTVAFTAKAVGVQIYSSTADVGAPAKWTFQAPLAELSGPKGVIYHYAGPSWEAADGSKVMRDIGTPVTTVPAPRDADIPWLLIKVNADRAAGVLDRVDYVQRLSTHGGIAPVTPPVRAGTTIGVPYTATYVFYVKSS